MFVNGVDTRSVTSSFAIDGAYRVGPATPGRHRLSLDIADRGAASGAARIVLAEIDVVAGDEVVHDFDLTDGFPSALTLKVEFPRLPEARAKQIKQGWLRVRAIPSSTSLATSATTTEFRKGSCVLGPLAPGRWRLEFSSRSGVWTWSPSQDVVVPPGAPSEMKFDVPISEVAVAFLDARDGGLLASTVLRMELGASSGSFPRLIRTNEAGQLLLMLAPGTYSVAVENMDSFEGSCGLPETLEWGETGPTITSLRLMRP